MKFCILHIGCAYLINKERGQRVAHLVYGIVSTKNDEKERENYEKAIGISSGMRNDV